MRPALFPTLAMVMIAGACAPAAPPAASLETGSDHGTYRVEAGPFEEAYPLRFRCIENCPRAVDFVAAHGDHPLGLFSRDQDDLVFYLSSGGVAYQVRAWQITATGVKPVLEAYSRARPDFLSDPHGHAVVQTYEGESNIAPLRLVRWIFRDGAFAREPDPGSPPSAARTPPP